MIEMRLELAGSIGRAALDMVFEGLEQAIGYTEFVLYKRRREQKAV